MELSKVTTDDGRKCAQLLNLLKVGRWDLAGADIGAYTETVQWVHSLATQMAQQLQTAKAAPAPTSSPPADGFRVKSMGQGVPAASGGSKGSRKGKKK